MKVSGTKAQRQFQAIVAAGAAALGPDEFWCIGHPDGLLEQTASKDLTYPVRLFCTALGVDWDDAQEQGYHLTRATLPAKARST